MTRRKRLWLALVGVLGGVVLALWLASKGHRICEESVDKIQLGMTPPEVEQILGCPPGDYSSSELLVKFGDYIPLEIVRGITRALSEEMHRIELWAGDSGVVLIHFDKDNRVNAKSFSEVMPSGTFMDKIRRWLRLGG
jgi:hypothetical protein